MCRFFTVLTGLCLVISPATGQEAILAHTGYKTTPLMSGSVPAGPFDLRDTLLYLSASDTVFCMDLRDGGIVKGFPVPEGYEAYPAFLKLSATPGRLWAGYTTLGNADDRIYRIDLENGKWDLVARMPGHFDLAFWNDEILVSGLNSTSWTDPGSIFLLDTTGRDLHRKVAEIGGYAAGLAVDEKGCLYYGSSGAGDIHALYRWDSSQIAAVVGDTGSIPLAPHEARALTHLPAGAGDCEVDEGGNVVFSFNDPASPRVLALWRGTPGDAFLFDTLATVSGEYAWLGMMRTEGDIRVPREGNRIVTYSSGTPLTSVHPDYLPLLSRPLWPVSGVEGETGEPLDLSGYFTDPDDDDAFTFEVAGISDSRIASPNITGTTLQIRFLSPGQTNVRIRVMNGSSSIMQDLVVGVRPELNGEYLVAGFEDLGLGREDFWNGSDGSGEFRSGVACFHNSYHPEWLTWSGWAYSSMSDRNTPGYLNQYSAVTGRGAGTDPDGSQTYGVSYVQDPAVITFKNGESRSPAGFFVTNSTYAALSMAHGDMFAKRFGGSTGTDPDYFKLLVWGRKAGLSTDTVEFFLADYRADSGLFDHIVRTWQWVGLEELGEIDSLLCSLESSDMGEWGMRTPAYFCMDRLLLQPGEIQADPPEDAGSSGPVPEVYPNPFASSFVIRFSPGRRFSAELYSMEGRKVYENSRLTTGGRVDLAGYPPGPYMLRVTDGRQVATRIVIKKKNR